MCALVAKNSPTKLCMGWCPDGDFLASFGSCRPVF